MAAVGLIPSSVDLGWFAPRWDKRDDFLPEPDGDGYDYAGDDLREGPEGIESKAHPVALLAEEPLLWGTVSRWNAGLRELTPDDYERLSAFELSAKRAMAAAAGRALGGTDG
jgi:hypothetical protein